MILFSGKKNNTEYDSVYEKIAENHIPPIVIEKEMRADYFSRIAECDTAGLAKMIADLSDRESERIQKFR